MLQNSVRLYQERITGQKKKKNVKIVAILLDCTWLVLSFVAKEMRDFTRRAQKQQTGRQVSLSQRGILGNKSGVMGTRQTQ